MTTSIPSAPLHIKCHRTGHRKKCADLCQNCWLWMCLPTKDGSEWMCADLAQVKLLYSLGGEMNGAGRATESMRNEIIARMDKSLQGRLLVSGPLRVD